MKPNNTGSPHRPPTMKSYLGLTSRYLRNQLKRTVLTIIGIVFSAALICGTGILGSSFKEKMIENIKVNNGDYHVLFKEISAGQLESLQHHLAVAETGVLIPVAHCAADRQKIAVWGCNGQLIRIIGIQLAAGRLPVGKREIILESWAIENMHPRPKIGDTLHLPLIITGQVPTMELFASRPSKPVQTTDFVLVGEIGNRPDSQYEGVAKGLVGLGTAERLLTGISPRFLAAVRFKPGLQYQPIIRNIQKTLHFSDRQVKENAAILAAIGQSKRSNLNQTILMIQGIIFFLIVIATVAVIFNAFQISVLERVRQFGLLRAVGATPAQIRRIVWGEAAILSLIGIPLGIGSGMGAVKLLLTIFSWNTASLFGQMQFILNPPIIALTIVLGLLAVFGSAVLPVQMLNRISPLEAIQNNTRFNREKIKPARRSLFSFLWGIEGQMAIENLKRNRVRFWVTIFSICTGIVLTIVFCGVMHSIESTSYGSNFQMDFFYKDISIDKPFDEPTAGYTRADYDELRSAKGVKKVYRLMQSSGWTRIPTFKIKPDYLKYYQKKPSINLNQDPRQAVVTDIYAYHPSLLEIHRRNLTGGVIDSQRMEDENGILLFQGIHSPQGLITISAYKTGDWVEIELDRNRPGQTVKMKILGTLKQIPLYQFWDKQGLSVVMTEKQYRNLTGRQDFTRFDIELDSKGSGQTVLNKAQAVAARVPHNRVFNYTEFRRIDRLLKNELATMLYGLVAVISIIGLLNIINTINTSLILRTREFGILQAVGMTDRQIRKMIRLEGLFYGLIAAIWGNAVGLALSGVLYQYFIKIRWFSWRLPWEAMTLCSVAAFDWEFGDNFALKESYRNGNYGIDPSGRVKTGRDNEMIAVLLP